MKDLEKEKKEIQSYVLSLVAKREYTRVQLQKKIEKLFPERSPEVMDKALNISEEKGFFSDERFARIYIRQGIRKGDGPLKIKQKLWEKGVQADLTQSLLPEEYDLDMQYKAACDLALKNKNKKETPEKMIRYLAGKGFSSTIAYKALKKLDYES